jgi:hypothetical protein
MDILFALTGAPLVALLLFPNSVLHTHFVPNGLIYFPI